MKDERTKRIQQENLKAVLFVEEHLKKRFTAKTGSANIKMSGNYRNKMKRD